MSVHLYVTRLAQFGNHAEWEQHFRRNVGHKYFARTLLPNLPADWINNDSPGGIEWMRRPTDFAAWRDAIAADANTADTNLLAMVDLLEREPEFWLYVSD